MDLYTRGVKRFVMAACRENERCACQAVIDDRTSVIVFVYIPTDVAIKHYHSVGHDATHAAINKTFSSRTVHDDRLVLRLSSSSSSIIDCAAAGGGGGHHLHGNKESSGVSWSGRGSVGSTGVDCTKVPRRRLPCTGRSPRRTM